LSGGTKQDIEKILAQRELCRRRLFDFFRLVAWPTIEQGTPLSTNWCVELICDHLEALGRRELGDFGHSLAIFVPPRHSKSSIAGIAFPMWLWLNNPTERFLHVSYNLDLAITHATQRRDLVKSEAYQRLRTVTLGDDNRKTIRNAAHGYSRVLPKGRVTGNGATGLIMDDVHPTTASAAEIAKDLQFYKGGLKSRLNQRDSFKLLIMQRVGENDLGWQCENEGYKVLKVAAMASERRIYTFLRSDRQIEVPEDTLIDPSRLTDDLDVLKQDAKTWATQYLQEPKVEGGMLFNPDDFTTNPAYGSVDWQNCVISVDSASSEQSYSCYWAITVWNYNDPKGVMYLKWVHREKMEYRKGKAALVELIELHKPWAVLIENKSTGISLLSDLPTVLSHQPVLVPIKPSGSKVVRAERAAELLKWRTVALPDSAWVKDFKDELEYFPMSAYDDQVDSVTQFVNWLGDSESIKHKAENKLFVLD
jgi:predicted phage terminase large subunit-like protein